MREISSRIELSPLRACWEGSGFTPGPPKDTSGAQRKHLFSSYADHITWSDPEQVARALAVFEGMLRAYRNEMERYPGSGEETPQQKWGRELDRIRREFDCDGYQITESLRILKAGESRPDHEMADVQLYAEALRVLRHARNQMERLPSVTRGKGEEDIRDVLLVALGAAFAGRCTAESLNGAGKTDLLLRIGDRNVLVGECKFWRGSTKFPTDIDQLFGYLTRYDSFAVLPLFIRAARPEEIVAKAAQVLSEHPRCVSVAVPDHEGRQYKFVLRSASLTPWNVEVALIPFVIS
ncbi:hypothetical protein [Streptomyces spectabilis]|uniref:Uncharacterized protein n=1 Tax=Streptomyces spectabilis TaxID=68270 RepID=A0A7W8B3E4_STRST|nr:hypothetical protein [Streptomyces spectabilis]MBB5109620.1 hypothetical protein [Streptomyces spectabilis]